MLSFFSLLSDLQYLLIPLLILSTDARIISSQHDANGPLTIDTLSTDNVVHVPVISSNSGLSKRQTTAPVANTTVCYPLVGCFDNNEPFNNAGFEVPQSPDFVQTAFLLFTQESPTNPEFLQYDDDESILSANLNPSRYLRIIIHGFQNNRDSVWIPPLRNELLKLKNV